MSGKDYKRLYQIEDKILLTLKPVLLHFISQGARLWGSYLNHRFSEDLDFFMNQSDSFNSSVKTIEKVLTTNFLVLRNETIVNDDYVRYYIEYEDVRLKIEFVNDIAYRCGVPNKYLYGLIDTPLNILTNKITAIVGRDEPKDVFDIYTMAQHYKFHWLLVFGEAKNKVIINEIEVEQRIKSFPVDFFQKADWHILPFDSSDANKAIQILANDFLLGTDNSLGRNQPPIEKAKVKV